MKLVFFRYVTTYALRRGRRHQQGRSSEPSPRNGYVRSNSAYYLTVFSFSIFYFNIVNLLVIKKIKKLVLKLIFFGGPTENRTQISRFKVLCDNHYTMGPFYFVSGISTCRSFNARTLISIMANYWDYCNTTGNRTPVSYVRGRYLTTRLWCFGIHARIRTRTSIAENEVS